MPDTPHVSELDLHPADGWYHARCLCGWTQGPFPDPETMVDALMEHSALAAGKERDQQERFKWAANQRADDLAEAGKFMLDLIDAIYGTDNEGMDLPDEAEYRRFRKIIEEPHDA